MFEGLTDRIAKKMATRRTLGWFDWSGDSWDMRVANARAARIVDRIRNGVRRRPLRTYL
jgi:hypothetical protein